MDPIPIIQVIGVGTVAIATLVVVVGATVRLVFAPVMKAKRLAASTAAATATNSARLDGRMDALEEEVRHLGEALDRVAAAAEFDAQLRTGAAPRQQLPPT